MKYKIKIPKILVLLAPSGCVIITIIKHLKFKYVRGCMFIIRKIIIVLMLNA